ncbi:MAG: EamA family transporter [Kiloniellales bacterium]|nr:EamA family transporter [Kiloniellales bacterium]
MSTTVFLAVLAAALLHAGWNALVKGGGDKHLNMTAVVLGSLPIALGLLAFVPAPARESWGYLAAGVALHAGYHVFLLFSYRIGELTQVYPIARGSAPLLVAGVSVLFLGVPLTPAETLAVLVIAAGVMSTALVRRSDGLRNPQAALLAVVTGGFIAAYSLVDGNGARLAGTALGFYCWLTIGNVILFAAFIACTQPGLLLAVPLRAKQVFLLGGAATFIAYALVIWAFTQAPIALVAALRETSILFALVIGVGVLKERLDLAKVFSTLVTLLGAALMRLSKS